MGKIWDSFLTERDKAVMQAAGFGTRAGFGSRPALLIIDVTYGFTGDRPEPILESIKEWSGSCGEESWTAISVMKDLASTFRKKNMPVIYSAGVVRPDNWDAGSWSWKNARTDEEVPATDGRPDFNGIVSDLEPQPQDIVILKQKPSAFYGTNLISYMNLLGADSLIIVGATTSGCLRATVLDAFSNNIRFAVVEEGCFDRCQASHAINLFDIDSKYGDVVSVAEVESYLAGLSDDLFPNLPPKSS